MPWRRAWQPTPVFLPGKSHGQRSLVDNSPWGRWRVRHAWATEHGTAFPRPVHFPLTRSPWPPTLSCVTPDFPSQVSVPCWLHLAALQWHQWVTPFPMGAVCSAGPMMWPSLAALGDQPPSESDAVHSSLLLGVCHCQGKGMWHSLPSLTSLHPKNQITEEEQKRKLSELH